MPIPQAQAILHRTGDDANPTAGGRDPGNPSRLVEQALGEELRLPVTRLAGGVEVVYGLFGHSATTPPSARGGNARDEEEERLTG